MESLRFPSGKEIGPNNVAKFKSFVQRHELTKDGKAIIFNTKWEDDRSFHGNFHCETLMLSLQLLHQTQAARDEVSSDDNNEYQYLQLPSKDVIDKFANPTKVLPVPKRCCPKCVNENTDENILYPGHYEDWFTAALPPWLPRKADIAVIKAAETKLVNGNQNNLKFGKLLMHSSAGISPITSY
ncbi:hypothetical protein PTT_09860 [Pyrenophora teres f. teres 0-1]|uniref:Uncharacterized protein n=1 Tax=Pyrenophora teres f. teres (strain 0-1) TaxID=861557 RepID=E3RMW5_PYRTT|nr:hypothetical protein PTT_09860 [Pyrenophora teres f. teres 0-1]